MASNNDKIAVLDGGQLIIHNAEDAATNPDTILVQQISEPTMTTDSSDLAASTDTEVVQIVMQQPQSEPQQLILPEEQFLQLPTGHTAGEVQYLQVTNENGEVQFIQITADGQAHYVQMVDEASTSAESAMAVTSHLDSLAHSMGEMPQPDAAANSQDENSMLIHEEAEEGTQLETSSMQNIPVSTVKSEGLDLPTTSVATSSQSQVLDTVKLEGSDSVQEDNQELSIIQQDETSQESMDQEESVENPPKQTGPKQSPPKKLDLSSPIEVTSETIVMVKGRKCALRVDPNTNNLVAFPIRPPNSTGRKRGRPRKRPRDENDQVIKTAKLQKQAPKEKQPAVMSEKESSAAEGLLGLSEVGPDGTRRSRRSRKKPRVLTEYETGAIEGVEEPPDLPDVDDDPRDADVKIPIALLNATGETHPATYSAQTLGEIYSDNAVYTVTDDGTVVQTGGKRPDEDDERLDMTEKKKGSRPKVNQQINSLQNYLANLGLPVKRGRGRPRRRPLQLGADPNSKVPALIIPAPDGQAVMMAPVQGLDTTKLPKALRSMDIFSGTGTVSDQSVATSSSSSVIINNADGTQTCVLHPQQLLGGDGGGKEGGEFRIMEDMLTSVSGAEGNLQTITLSSSTDNKGNNTFTFDPENGSFQVIRMREGGGEEEEVIEIGTEQAQQLLELDGSTVELMMDDNLTDAMIVEGNLESSKEDNEQVIIIKPEARDAEAADAVAQIQIDNTQGNNDEATHEEGNGIESINNENQVENTEDISTGNQEDIVASLQGSIVDAAQEGIMTNEHGDIMADDQEDVMDTEGMITMVEQSGQEEDSVDQDITPEEEDESPEVSNAAALMSSALASALNSADKDKGHGGLAPTIIHLPQNLVPLLLQKKDPPKIGLRASEEELAKLKCPRCDYQAYYQHQFQAHLQSHSDEVEKCKCCQYLTFSKDDLLQHFKDAHPKCICSVCGYTAEHAYIIKRHMQRHNPAGCECEICGKTYKDQYILKMHVKMVHMPAEVLFECNICHRSFNRKAHLKRHIRIHEPEKPYKCPQCDYRGCERSDITKHLLIHDEPHHTCEVCGKAFRHLKNKDLHLKRHKGQRDYKCGICDFYGYTFTDIRKHIERKHSDTRAGNIHCEKCGMAFRSEKQSWEHQQKQCELFLMEQQLAEAEETGGLPITPGQLHGDDPDTPATATSSSQVVIDATHSLTHAVLTGEEHGGQLSDAAVKSELGAATLHYTSTSQFLGENCTITSTSTGPQLVISAAGVEQSLMLAGDEDDDDSQHIQGTEGVELDGQVVLDPTQVINSVAEIRAAAAAAAAAAKEEDDAATGSISIENIQMSYTDGHVEAEEEEEEDGIVVGQGL